MKKRNLFQLFYNQSCDQEEQKMQETNNAIKNQSKVKRTVTVAKVNETSPQVPLLTYLNIFLKFQKENYKHLHKETDNLI